MSDNYLKILTNLKECNVSIIFTSFGNSWKQTTKKSITKMNTYFFKNILSKNVQLN